MTRTHIYLTDEQRDSLGTRSARTGRPMSELIREALDEYLHRHADERRQQVLRTAAGLWADRADMSQVDTTRATLDRGFRAFAHHTCDLETAQTRQIRRGPA